MTSRGTGPWSIPQMPQVRGTSSGWSANLGLLLQITPPPNCCASHFSLRRLVVRGSLSPSHLWKCLNPTVCPRMSGLVFGVSSSGRHGVLAGVFVVWQVDAKLLDVVGHCKRLFSVWLSGSFLI